MFQKRNINGPYLFLVIVVSFAFTCAGQHPASKLRFVTVDEELSLGDELAAQAIEQLRLVRNQRVVAFLNEIAQEIGAQSDWSGLTYTVSIVNEPEINHFSLPGGHIYLFRGLIEAAETASEVATIIAHEIAHVAARHGVYKVARIYGFAFAAQSVMGENPEIAKQIVANLFTKETILSYSKDDEFLADQKSIEYAWKANYDPTGLLDMLKTIRMAEKQQAALVTLLLKTHPRTSSRYKRARMEISHIPRKSTLRKDLPEFKTIKNILKKIPG